MQLHSPKVVRDLLSEFGLAPLKKLGQNFLLDEHIVERIAQAGVDEGGNCLEIGPGLGTLTRALSRRARKVVAVEIDSGMVRVLEKTLAQCDNVEVVHADFLKVDLAELAQRCFGGQPYSVVGNLPYYITSKCILKVLEEGGDQVQSLTVMMQKEVAQRLASPPGNKLYGAITASVAYYGQPQELFGVSHHCFYPAPDVESAVVQILPSPMQGVERAGYARVVRALFAKRRKTVLNNLKSGLGLSSEAAKEVLRRSGIPENERAEQLSKDQFAILAQNINEI